LRHNGLIPKHGLGDLPKVEGSPTVVCPKARRLLAGFQWRVVICYRTAREDASPAGCILVGADNGALHNDTGGACHRQKFGLVPPQPLAALPALVAESVVTPVIQGNCCRGHGGSVWKAGERSTKCYALLRMRPLLIPCAECSVVISCGKVDYENLASEAMNARCGDYV
jgi:hypothetical protein